MVRHERPQLLANFIDAIGLGRDRIDAGCRGQGIAQMSAVTHAPSPSRRRSDGLS
jgi:hypothetical protein